MKLLLRTLLALAFLVSQAKADYLINSYSFGANIFPTVQGTTVTTATTASTSHAASLPASIVSGELLELEVTVNTGTITAPAGWSTLYNASPAAFFYLTATGSEGATVTVTTGTSTKFVSIARRISQWSGTPEVSTVATATSVNPDSSSVTPSWGSDNQLYISVAHGFGRFTGISAYPTGYTDQNTIDASSGSSAGLASAVHPSNGTSEDPSAFTANASIQWFAYTVAIKPGP